MIILNFIENLGLNSDCDEKNEAIINNITMFNSFDYKNNYIRDIKKKFV